VGEEALVLQPHPPFHKNALNIRPRRLGVVLDCVLEAEVVTADLVLVRTNATRARALVQHLKEDAADLLGLHRQQDVCVRDDRVKWHWLVV
jgi:hypothetical protein